MKTVLVDGHNLIPKIPGLHLEDLDDENKLIDILLVYCRTTRTQVELFFDGAPLDKIQKKKLGLIRVHPVRKGLTADDAIIAFLRASGNASRNMSVVSSDHRVQVEAKALHAVTISSETFSIEIQKVLSSPQIVEQEREKTLSAAEVEEWERIFKTQKGK